MSAPNPPIWEENSHYHYIGYTKSFSPIGEMYFRINSQDFKGWRVEFSSQKELHRKIFNLQTNVGHDIKWEGGEVKNVKCDKMQYTPMEMGVCEKGQFQGTEMIPTFGLEHEIAYKWTGCDFDSYIEQFFPRHQGYNYTVYTDVFNTNRIFKVCLGECENTDYYVAFSRYEIVSDDEMKNKLSIPEFCQA